MILKYRTQGVAVVLAGASLLAAESGPMKVASGHRDILLQTTQSWNGKRYTHYPTGQPQLTTIKLTSNRTPLCLAYSSFPKCCLCAFGPSMHENGGDQGRSPGEASENRSMTFIGARRVTNPRCLLITYAGTPGVPTSVPAKGEKAEY